MSAPFFPLWGGAARIGGGTIDRARVASSDLAWLLTRPGVTGPIVGPRTAAQLESAVRAAELELSEELLASLDEIFPGPGPSPEAFAW